MHLHRPAGPEWERMAAVVVLVEEEEEEEEGC